MCDFGLVSGPAIAAGVSSAGALTASGLGLGVGGASIAAGAGSALSFGSIASTALSVGSLISSGIGAITGAQGANAAGVAQAQQAQYAAQVAETNRRIAENNRAIAVRNIEVATRNREDALRASEESERTAQEALQRGTVEEQLHAREVAKLKGRQRAVLAANGVVVDEGSALDVTSDTAELGKFEQLTIRANAQRDARGFVNEAKRYRTVASNFATDAQNFATEGGNAVLQGQIYNNEADAARLRASSALSAGRSSAVSTLLTGAGSVASKWYSLQKSGAFKAFG